MSTPDQATPREMRWIGAGALAGGLYLVLVGAGVLPVPGGDDNLHGPLWLVVLIGVAVLLAGIAAFIQGLGRANASGELPEDAPRALRAAQYFVMAALFACFAAVGSWVALAGESRQFSGGLPFVAAAINVAFARIMFGFGALICWLGAFAAAMTGLRKLLGDGRT